MKSHSVALDAPPKPAVNGVSNARRPYGPNPK
jgi:hypothetical protein